MNFDKVQQLMDDSLKYKQVYCSDIIITYQGKTVYRYKSGNRDENRLVPLKGDELYFLYSASKVITCTALLQLLEKGKISLEDPVAKYIPEYGDLWVSTEDGVKKAQTPMLLKHLFTMTSGLDYNLEKEGIVRQRNKKPDSSTLEIVRTFTQEPLLFEPGTHYNYSLSHDVLAAVLELVTDMSFGDYLKKNIFEVCGMENTGFKLDDEIRSRMCSQYEMNEETGVIRLIEKENGFILTPAYESGGAGIISCVEDYGRFVAALANTEKLLKKETIDLMRQNHLGAQPKAEFDLMKPGYTYGLGVRTDLTGRVGARGEFGWDGAAGAYALIDPDRHIGLFYATHIRGYGGYLYNTLHPAIRDAVYEVLG